MVVVVADGLMKVVLVEVQQILELAVLHSQIELLLPAVAVVVVTIMEVLMKLVVLEVLQRQI